MASKKLKQVAKGDKLKGRRQLAIATKLSLPALLWICSVAWCLSPDQDALIRLRSQLNGNNDSSSVSSTWDTQDSDPCQWAGVHCYDNSVMNLSLQGLLLHGTIPPGLSLLQSLVSLDLSNNSIKGNIPPSLSNCSSLTTLNLSSNLLQGPVPPELQKLQRLQTLDLSKNMLFGSIPSELGTLDSLQKLNLASNNFTGTLPPSFGNLLAMEDLSVSQNFLGGSIPDISKLSNLRSFSAYQNKFTGIFPNMSTKSLRSVNLASNNLNGSIPSTICASGQLAVLVLTSNRLTGSLPGELGSCQSLVSFRVGQNALTGLIPPNFGQLPNLVYFEANQNNLVGGIPANVDGWKNLSLLNLAHNSLTGSIPSALSTVPKLQELLLSYNNLRGGIPGGLWQCQLLSVLDLSKNLLTGAIPGDLCNGLTKLVSLRLEGNLLSGPIPLNISNCGQLLELKLGDNRLTESIPSTVGTLINLQVSLNLSLNQLSGTIPSSLHKLGKLVSLDLSNNQLTGNIPPLEDMVSLLDWNFSNNLLSGPVPSIGLQMNRSPSTYASSFANNSGLCGGPLPPCGTMVSRTMVSHRSATSVGTVAGISTAFVVVAMVFIIGLALRIMHTRKFPTAVDPTTSPLTSSHVFTSGLEESINFDSIKEASQKSSNIISKNQWSTLYKAIMPSGLVVAGKRLHPREKGLIVHQRKIMLELHKFSRLLHDNIMYPFGYLLENDLVIIIYDFVPSCSLRQKLHRSSEHWLSWSERLDVAIGAASGLAFLHHSHYPVMHMDVTSNNIFLGPDMEVKVGDVEVGKLLDPSKNTGSISAVAGSLGYIAPEYAFTMRVTMESNVYSFGVVLLELVTSRRPIDESFGDGLDLVKWVHGSSSRGEMPEQVLDARISTRSFSLRQEMLAVLKVALLCTSASPLRRPRMKRILEMLIDAKLPAEAHSQKP